MIQKQKLTFSLALLCLLALMSLSSAQEKWWEDCKATSVDSNNWNKLIGQDKYVFLEFYTTYCIWCKRLMPEYNKLYDMYNGPSAKRSDLLIAKINGGGENEDIAYAYGVTIYPTLILIEKGSNNIRGVYNQERTAPLMQAWIESMLPPPEPKQASPKQVTPKQASPKPVPKEEPKLVVMEDLKPVAQEAIKPAPSVEANELKNKQVEEELRNQIYKLQGEIVELLNLRATHEETIRTQQGAIEDLNLSVQAATTLAEAKSHEYKPEGFGVGTLVSSFVLGAILGTGIGIVYKTLNYGIHMKP